MNTTTFTGRAAAVAAACAVSICAGQAQAQSYTLKTLASPPLGTQCELMKARLSSTGDVAAPCLVSQASASSLADFFNFLRYGEIPATPGVYHLRMMLWRANGTTAKVTANSNPNSGALLTGFQPNGDLLGLVWESGTDPNQALAAWRNGARITLSLPGGLSQPHWRQTQISPGGRALLFRDLDVPGRLAVWLNGQATVLPDPPAACFGTQADLVKQTGVSETGLVATLGHRQVKESTWQLDMCAWNGSNWVGPQVVPGDGGTPYELSYNPAGYPFAVTGVTTSGKVLVGTPYGARIAWVPGVGFETPLANVLGVGVNDVLLGGQNNYFQPAGAKATLWRNGVAMDLNSMAKPPAGQNVVRALDVNAKGQVLAVMMPTEPRDAANSAKAKLVVLTPK